MVVPGAVIKNPPPAEYQLFPTLLPSAERCDHNTQMKLRRQDVEIASKCTGATFSLTEDDGAEYFDRVDSFKYLGRFLHRIDED